MSSRKGGEADPEYPVEVSVDRSGSRPRIVVTDAACETAWLSVPARDCCSLREWR